MFGIRNTYLPALLLCAASPGLFGATLFFNGDLRTGGVGCETGCTSDADYAQFAAVISTFNVASPSTMYAVSFSFGGGTSGTGAGVASGGFAPYLSLFDSAGNFLASTYSGTTCPGGANTFGGDCFDVRLDGGLLAAGQYSIAISAFENMSLAENYGDPSLKLSDGFTGLGNLGDGQDLHYGFDVVLDSEATISASPEPGTAMLMIAAPLILVGLKKRRKQ